MKREWQQVTLDGVRPQWAGIYVTMNRKGEIVMNRVTYQKLGEPDGIALFFDKVNSCIGLQPTSRQLRNAFPVRAYGRHGGRCVRAFKLMQEHRIRVPETLEFGDAEIDEDGILVLDLRTAKVSKRALNHPSKRHRAEIA